jgi:DNA-binding SARP family transcriptional activator
MSSPGPSRVPEGNGIHLRVLGPLEAGPAGGPPVPLGPPRQRAVLGLLALAPGTLVHRDDIIDELWPAGPPATAVGLVQAYVSRLRRVLVPHGTARARRALIASAGASYRLQAEPGELDLIRFRQEAERGAAAAGRDPAAACDSYEAALRLWRGWPLADVDLLRDSPRVLTLRERHRDVVLRHADAAAAAGRHHVIVPGLRLLAAAEPLDERAHARLMIALAGSGQQAAALAVYAGITARLDDELGIRPGPDIEQAHLRVLRQELGAGVAPGSLPAEPVPSVPGPACATSRPRMTGRRDRCRRAGRAPGPR